MVAKEYRQQRRSTTRCKRRVPEHNAQAKTSEIIYTVWPQSLPTIMIPKTLKTLNPKPLNPKPHTLQQKLRSLLEPRAADTHRQCPHVPAPKQDVI